LNRLPLLEDANIERLVRTPGPGDRLPEYIISCRLREHVSAQPKREE